MCCISLHVVRWFAAHGSDSDSLNVPHISTGVVLDVSMLFKDHFIVKRMTEGCWVTILLQCCLCIKLFGNDL